MQANEITILSVCLSPSNQLLNQSESFHEIQFKVHDIEGNLDAIAFNAVAATIPKLRTFRLLRWIQNLHHST
jgi:hypothetical protein